MLNQQSAYAIKIREQQNDPLQKGSVQTVIPSGGYFGPVLEAVKDATPQKTVFDKLFGPVLQTKNIENILMKTDSALRGKRAVLVFFSAQWCPPHRDFTRALLEAYSTYDGQDVEVVFVVLAFVVAVVLVFVDRKSVVRDRV